MNDWSTPKIRLLVLVDRDNSNRSLRGVGVDSNIKASNTANTITSLPLFRNGDFLILCAFRRAFTSRWCQVRSREKYPNPTNGDPDDSLPHSPWIFPRK